MNATRKHTAELVREGIAAAQAGRRTEARSLLTRATQSQPEHIIAWLWLSGVVDDPREREACMERVLALDPNHPAARKGLALARRQVVEHCLQAGLAALAEGDDDRARTLLTEVVTREEEHVEAWMALSEVVETPDEREICLENVLTLDPHHAKAALQLAELQQQGPPPPSPAPAAAPPPPAFEVEPPPDEGPEDPWVLLADEYGCPRCAAQTEPEEKHCPECGQSLWYSFHHQEGRSAGLWILIGLQVLSTLGALLGAGALLLLLPRLFEDPTFQLLLTEAGFTVEAIGILQPLLYATAFVSLGFSLLMLVGLYLRWPLIWYLLLLQAGLGFLSSLISFVLSSSSMATLVPALIGAALSGLYFYFVLQLEGDFAKDRVRLLLRLDRDATEGPIQLGKGRHYAQEHLWGLAALHFRRAAGQMENSDAYVALAIACIKMERWELAEAALERARRVNPEERQIPELQAIIDRRRETASFR